MGIELYPHQADLVGRTGEAFKHCKRVLLQAPTGSGKSVMASYILGGAVRKGRKPLFVVPRKDLITQMSSTFRAFDIKHSFIASGLDYEDAPAHICSLQTLVKRMDGDLNTGLICLDETHWGGESINKLIKYLTERNIPTIGLSATPARADNFGMGDWYEAMEQGPSIRWLIDNRFLSEYGIIQPDVRIKHQTGDHVDKWLQYAGGRRTICYCKDVAHSQQVAVDFTKAGIPAAHMDAETPDDIRKLIIRDFADGKLLVITNVFLFQMGFDLASQVSRKVNVRCILDLQRTESLTAQMQKWGRGLRYDEDGHAMIIDLAGNSLHEAHGLPCEDRQWVLDTADQHKKDVERRAREMKLITCKKCYRPSKLGPPWCPHCGAKFQVDSAKIKIVDGKLVEITPEELKAIKEAKQVEKIKKNKEMDPEKRQAKIDALKRHAEKNGYSPGWLYHMRKSQGLL